MRAILGTNERYFSLVDSVQKYCFFYMPQVFLLYDYTTNNNIENSTIPKSKNIQNTNKINYPEIFSIISEKLFKNCDKNELLFVSEIEKMTNFNLKEKIKYIKFTIDFFY